MPELASLPARRAIPVRAGASQKIPVRNAYTKTRLTFTGRDAGSVVVKVKMFAIGDDSLTKKVEDLREGDFENIVNGTIDLAQRKSIIINGELSCLWITDSGSADFVVDVHQTN